MVTEYVEDRDARLTILKQKQAAQGTAQNPSAVISLAELQANGTLAKINQKWSASRTR